MRKTFLTLALLAALVTGVLAPNAAGTVSAAPAVQSTTQSHAQLFNRTRFVVDLGVAFFAFHHWCYNPYKAHAFDKSAPHHVKDIIKCGVALLFTVNRVRAAQKAANTSSSKTLKLLVTPINKLGDAFTSVGTKLKAGTYNPLDLFNLNRSVTAIGAAAAAGGSKIKDVPLSIPGL